MDAVWLELEDKTPAFTPVIQDAKINDNVLFWPLVVTTQIKSIQIKIYLLSE